MSDRTCSVEGCDRASTPTNRMCGMHYQRLRKKKPCTVDGCTRGLVARGMCPAHYQQARRDGFAPIELPTCSVDGCSESHHGLGFCKVHYLRFCRKGCTELNGRLPDAYRVLKMRELGRRRKQRERDAAVEKFTKQEIFERDRWICGLCNRPIDRTLRHPDRWSVSLDHILPLIHGGLHSRANTQAAHLFCNLSKNSRMT